MIMYDDAVITLSRVSTYIFLSEIDEVLQVDVVPIRPDVVVDEQVELVFNPVLEDKRQNSRR